jgi:hypothetical protein
MSEKFDELVLLCEEFYDAAHGLDKEANEHKLCNCENSKCHHNAGECENKAGDTKVIYIGAVCDACAKKTPAEYIKKAMLEVEAAEKRKLDPKAEVRNRGTVVFPALSCSDNKDHFPINDAGQARNALARSHQYTSVPSWYKGSLSSLQEAVRRKVKAKFPSIDVSPAKKKKSQELLEQFTAKYGQAMAPASAAPSPDELTTKMNAILQPLGYAINHVQVAAPDKTVFVKVKALPNAKFQGTGHQGASIAQALAPVSPPGMKIEPSVEF